MTTDLTIPEKLIHSTVKIGRWRSGKVVGSGTGFFYAFFHDGKEVPVLITNRHVIRDCAELRITFHLAETRDATRPSKDVIHIEYVIGNVALHPDPNVDLCALPIGYALNTIVAAGRFPFYQIMTAHMIPGDWGMFDVIEDVVMIGYPRGLFDEVHFLPLVRRGITSTAISVPFNGRKEFMVDMACYPGSSGSPVFVYNPDGYFDRAKNTRVMGQWRLHLVGVLRGGPEFTAKGEIVMADPEAVTKIPMHLGNVIRADQILELEKPLHEMLENMKEAEAKSAKK